MADTMQKQDSDEPKKREGALAASTPPFRVAANIYPRSTSEVGRYGMAQHCGNRAHELLLIRHV